MKTLIPLTLILALIMVNKTQAQIVPCEPNLGFEDSSFAYWQFFQGYCCSPFSTTTSVTPPLGPTTINRMKITSGTGLDPYGGFPIVAPGGGNYSFKLGTDDNGRLADRARYVVHVPTGSVDFAIIYHYAVVLQDPGHPTAAQPRFSVSTTDSASGTLLPCGQHLYVAGALPGFIKSAINPGVYYKPWATGLINLSSYAGKTIYLDFARGDCDYGGHFGYGYFDLSCGSNKIKINYSLCNTVTSLSGPAGFGSYRWMDESLTTLIDTTVTITIPTPYTPTIYKLILSPYAGFGCIDTLSVTISKVNIRINDTALCLGKSLSLTPTITSGSTPFKFKWTPSVGLSCDTCRNPILTGIATNDYIVTIQDSLGCEDSDTTHVEVHKLPVIKVDNGNVCLGDSNKVTVSGGVKYKWSPATGLDCDTCFAPTFSPRVTTQYTVWGVDTNGCTDTSSFILTVKKAEQISTDSIGPLCIGSQIKLKVRGSSNYIWSPAASLSCPTCDTTFASPLSSTTYSVIGIDSNLCKDTLLIPVTVIPLPYIWLPKASIVCEGDSLQLYALGAETFKWYPSEGLSCTDCDSPKTYPSKALVYTVVGIDANGCIDSNTLDVSIFYKSPININQDDSVCIGDTISLFAEGGTSYQWTPATGLSNDTIANPNASPTKSIVYRAIIQQGQCFTDTLNVSIQVFKYPTVHISGDSLIDRSQEIQLLASGENIRYYEWSPASLLNCSDCAMPNAKINDNTLFTVIVTAPGGCTAEDTFRVQLKPCNTAKIFIPNSFTPNGDGVNDLFYPMGVGINYVKDFLIYNRWGQVVFEQHNIALGDASFGWNGTFQGKAQPHDTFVYYLNAICEGGGSSILKGDITLIR